MTEKKSRTKKNGLFTILCVTVEFVTQTTADQKQMLDCYHTNLTIELVELK